jgi:hypothetical protein
MVQVNASSATAPQPAQPAARAKGRRLSKLAVFALIAAGIAPSMQVMRDSAGGHWLSADPAKSYVVLTALDSGALVLFVAAIIASLVALAQVIARPALRGGALAVGAGILAAAGMAGGLFGPTTGGALGAALNAMGGGGSLYVWKTTAVIAAAAIIAEIVIGLASAPVTAE